jgi:hypothetical protein
VKRRSRLDASEVKSLLAPERAIAAVPAATRERVLARARAACQAEAGRSEEPYDREQDRQSGSATRTALMFVVACVAGTALGVAASEIGTRLWPR